ncbi:hypothetical protein D9M69_710350 [compost metagenome]
MEQELSSKQVAQIARIVQAAVAKQETKLAAVQIAFTRLVGHLATKGVLDTAAFKAILRTDSKEFPTEMRADLMAHLGHLADAIRDCEVTAPPARH